MKIFDWLKPAKHISRLPHEQVESAYRKYRINNFIGIFMGYAAYYLLRGNFSLAMPFLSKMGHYSKTDLGKVAGILTVAYGISKFIMGNISDRSNPRYFIAVGLAISVIVNLIFGLAPGVTSSLLFMYVLMFTNGWAQGMGSPPCYRTVAHWYPISKRGEIMSAWNVAHNLGAAILGAISAYVIPNISFLNWQAIFYLPAIITIMIIVSVVLLMRDTPQSVGLMPVEEYSNDYPENADKQSLKEGEKELSAKEIGKTKIRITNRINILEFIIIISKSI